MKSTKITLLLSLALFVVIGNGWSQSHNQSGYATFGDEISPENASDYTVVIEKLETEDSIKAKISAKVDEVCQMKGCWMNVSTPENEVPIFVQFKDYGFFVPMDIAGKEVIMEGVAYKKMTSVEDLRHFAKDAGKSEDEIEKITEPQEEISFMAHGVLVKN